MNALAIKGLTKKYGDFTAVSQLDLEVGEGEVFGFIGRNGAGKSTTIKSVTGILPVTEGEITVCGQNVAAAPTAAKANIGYVPDDHVMYETMTGREYAYFIADCFKVGKERKSLLDELVAEFEMDAYIDKQIAGYSHGTKQKMCIIASLIHSPRLWILDEPLTGLDIQMSKILRRRMRRHAGEGNTVFFSSHNIDIVAKICDRAAVIDKGRLLEIIDIERFNRGGGDLEDYFFAIAGEGL